jgi:peptidoglycan lytic transglycosylase G
MKNKKRVSCMTIFLALVGFSGCLALLAMGWLAIRIPAQAAQTFGPASEKLSFSQQIYLSALLLRDQEQLMAPVDPNGSELNFRVALGESPVTIAQQLHAAGLVYNAAVFRNYLVYAGLDTTLQAGEYTLSPRMSPYQIAQALQDATPAQVKFNILPGWRAEEVAAALPTSGLNITPQDFMEALKTRSEGLNFPEDFPPQATLEGFLFPDSYNLARDLTANQLVTVFVQNFEAHLDNDMRQGFERQGLNEYQAVTLASIVQREAVIEDEMPIIASVFLNRLSAGFKLDSDPTVQYAIGYNETQNTWWTNPLSLEDLKINSPYNTYQVQGLPPGPIANPGLNALRAVAFPAQTPYYYFRAACDHSGRHVFSETFTEHASKACPNP